MIAIPGGNAVEKNYARYHAKKFVNTIVCCRKQCRLGNDIDIVSNAVGNNVDEIDRINRYLSEIDQRTENVTKEKHDRNIQLLRKRRFGGMLSDKEKHILNLSDYSLSDTERFVLSNGLDFCLPPKSVNRE